MSSKPYIDFYKKHGVAPVLNHVSRDFLEKRRGLYYQLKIPTAFLRGKKILEFGPGNGINSLFTHSLHPEKYVLVDANPLSLKNCRCHFAETFPDSNNYEIIDSLIEEFDTQERFDLVICEGVIPHQKDPSSFVKKISRFVASGGMLLVTCHDLISTFSEILRGFLGFLIVNQQDPFDKKVGLLTDFFSSHLAHLKGMNRKYGDWVVDNILYIDYWRDSPFFSMGEAIESLREDFIPWGFSPNYLTDGRWYKSLNIEENFGFASGALELFQGLQHNLIDYRYHFSSREKEKNTDLLNRISALREKMANYMSFPSHLKEIISDIREIEILMEEFSPATGKSLRSYRKALETDLKTPIELGDFEPWWGRGMQFASFLKIKE